MICAFQMDLFAGYGHCTCVCADQISQMTLLPQKMHFTDLYQAAL